MCASSCAPVFDVACRRCQRLSDFLKGVSQQYPDYYAKPVPPFGDEDAELLIVGLAPGMHGANRTGRPFTGDHAGILLYQTLYDFGFGSQPVSESASDRLELVQCRISNAVKCLPPQNKPVGQEERNCNHFLAAEISQPDLKIILTLGLLAHRAILRCLGLKLNRHQFGHNRSHHLDNGILLINSYHCSRYNTQTRRLTEPMFHEVFQNVRSQLDNINREL